MNNPFNEYRQQAELWFRERDPRERLLLIVCTLVVVVGGFYGLIWQPTTKQLQSNRLAIESARTDARWMAAASADAKRLQISGGSSNQVSGQPLLTLTGSSLRSAGLASDSNKIQPKGESEIRVWLDDKRFDAVLRWLDTLRQRHGVIAENLTVQRSKTQGLVTVRVTLKRAAA